MRARRGEARISLLRLLLDVNVSGFRSLSAVEEEPKSFGARLRFRARSIAAFLNTRGGRLLVGVADAGTVVGIEPDIASLEKMGLGAGGRDGFLQALPVHMAAEPDGHAVTQHLGAQAAALIRTQIAELDGRKVCVISVGRSPEPVYLHESKEKEEFFVRLESTTRPLGLRETTAYIRATWG